MGGESPGYDGDGAMAMSGNIEGADHDAAAAGVQKVKAAANANAATKAMGAPTSPNGRTGIPRPPPIDPSAPVSPGGGKKNPRASASPSRIPRDKSAPRIPSAVAKIGWNPYSNKADDVSLALKIKQQQEKKETRSSSLPPIRPPANVSSPGRDERLKRKQWKEVRGSSFASYCMLWVEMHAAGAFWQGVGG